MLRIPKGRIKLVQKKTIENDSEHHWRVPVFLAQKEVQLLCSCNEEGGFGEDTLSGPFNSGLEQAKSIWCRESQESRCDG